MGATYGTSLWKSLHGVTQEESIAILQELVSAGCCLELRELLQDGNMVTMQARYDKATNTESVLSTISKPTHAAIEGMCNGSAPYSLFSTVLEGVSVLVPEEGFDRAEFDLPFYSADADTLTIFSYERIIRLLEAELAVLSDRSADKWNYIDADPEQYLAFNQQLVDEMKRAEKAKLLFCVNF